MGSARPEAEGEGRVMTPDHRALIQALTGLADHHDHEAQRAVQFRIGVPAIVAAAQQRVHQDAARRIRQILTDAHLGELPDLEQQAEKDRHTGVVRGPGDEQLVCLYVMAQTAETAYRCTLPGEHPGQDHWNKMIANPRDDEDREAAIIWRERVIKLYGAEDPAEPVDLVGALKESITAAKDRRLRQIGEFDGDL